jgi:hypothetical protein
MDQKLLHIISHTDLDGVVSAALAWHINYGNSPIKISLTGYGMVDNLVLDGISQDQNMIVLDLFCQKDKTVDVIDRWYEEKDTGPFVFDHHQSNFARFAGRPWLVLDSSCCAASVYYRWLLAHPSWIKNEGATEKLKDIVNIANDRDMWINSIPESRLWHALVTLCGPWGVFARLVANPSGKLTDNEYETAVEFVTDQEERFKKAMEGLNRTSSGIVFVGDGVLDFGDVSDFGGRLLDSGEKVPLLVAVAARKPTGEWAVSLRSREGEAGKTVAMLKDGKRVRGGGHADAAALYFPPSYSENRIKESLEAALHTIREKDRPTGQTLGDIFMKAMDDKKS